MDENRRKRDMYCAVDFDNTLVTIHCLGHHDLDDLLQHKNDQICDMVQRMLNDGDVVGIATYNDRVDLIDQFCRQVFQKKLPIEGGLPSAMEMGKEEHIKRLFPNVPAHQIMLVDDNLQNCRTAFNAGHSAFHVN